MTTPPNGIEGLQGREPIAAALAVGRKGDSGAPTDRDRFHVLNAAAGTKEFRKRGGGTYNSPFREPHPGFGSFNKAPPERRRNIPARLAHATVAECWEYGLRAQTLPNLSHPKRAPVCRGDGVNAERWDTDEEDWLPMACPHDRCQHRQSDGRRPVACKPWMRFLARFDFPRDADGKGLPNVLMKFTSGSWNTTRNFLGFFEAFERNCRGLNVDPASIPLFGMPVVLQLQEKTDASQKHRFPVVSIVASDDMDQIAWILYQQSRLDELRALPAPARIIDVQDDHDPDLISGPQGLGE